MARQAQSSPDLSLRWDPCLPMASPWPAPCRVACWDRGPDLSARLCGKHHTNCTQHHFCPSPLGAACWGGGAASGGKGMGRQEHRKGGGPGTGPGRPLSLRRPMLSPGRPTGRKRRRGRGQPPCCGAGGPGRINQPAKGTARAQPGLGGGGKLPTISGAASVACRTLGAHWRWCGRLAVGLGRLLTILGGPPANHLANHCHLLERSALGILGALRQRKQFLWYCASRWKRDFNEFFA